MPFPFGQFSKTDDIVLTPTGDAAADTAAMDAAVTLAASTKRPIRLMAGIFQRTTPWDCRVQGLTIKGNGPAQDLLAGTLATVIKQNTPNTPVMQVGRSHQNIGGFLLTYATAPTSAHTNANALELYKSQHSVFSRIGIRNVGRGIVRPNVNYNDGDTATGNFSFSNTYSDIQITGCAINAIRFEAGAGSTGSVWNNIYISNNPNGTRLAMSGAIIEMKVFDEQVFNQLNIEWALLTSGNAIYAESGGNLVINGLHFEQLQLSQAGGAFIQVSDRPQLTINGFSFVYCDMTNNGTHSMFTHFQVGAVRSKGFYQHDNTVAGTFVLDNASGATGGSCTVEFDGDTSIFTGIVSNEKAAPLQVVTRVNETLYRWKQNGKNHTTGTAAPTTGTWAVGDTVWNTNPAAAGAPGWVCTTAGTPGTWKAMASLAA